MSNSKKAERTYGQYCPIAVGLDLLGDRWTLLICRELAIGDQRFTDLRNALPGIAPNLLSERLRALQAADLVTSVELPPPAARSVYRLTEQGKAVRPVLRALSKFGTAHLQGEPPEYLTASRAANSMLAAWRRAGGPEQRVRLDLGNEMVDIEVTEHDTRIVASEGDVDVVVRSTAAALVAARQGEPFDATLTGTAAARRAFLDTFRLQLAD
ncbi:winged helix-turn-helix transcriptional regulator [soil metagenome]